MKDKEQVLEFVEKKNVKFIKLWFSDILGRLKSFSITPRELGSALDEGKGFDGSSIKGFARIDESDMLAKPDPDTFRLLPWEPKDKSVGLMFCDILNPDGRPYEGDPRWVLKRNLERLKAEGYKFNVGPELEYFYFKGNKHPEILDEGGYFDLPSPDVASVLRNDTILALESMGIPVEYSHHEVSPSQQEIDLKYADALTMADRVMIYRMTVKEIAYQHGYYATFMPKPIYGINGSGMHTHQSLFKGKKNVFYDPSDKCYLSDTAKRYLAGLLKHAPEITLVTNQWINSYKRLVPGFEAPVYISWARRNRSTMIRVPMYQPGKEEATRIEFRSPDPACNPYLAFSVMLAAGLAGIENKYELPKSVEKDVYQLSGEERAKDGIKSLPGSLIEAIDATEKSELVRKTLGDRIFGHLITSKKVEWDSYRVQISEWEINEYLRVL
ncbi:MAG TPA: glutamine synthetase [Thermoplasmata archaeon]|nr:glutamine synthetase [Thermoplasmata archaeon]HIH97998.1 glutamine synthetase [Thermoplasmata archaeon]